MSEEWSVDSDTRALSWKEPFGSLMMIGKVETRIWTTKYRGWVLICLAKKAFSVAETVEISGYDQYDRMVGKLKETNPYCKPGYAIAIGMLSASRPMLPSDENDTFVKYVNGLHCHIYEQVIPIEPFEWKGKQGWRTLTMEQKHLIKIVGR